MPAPPAGFHQHPSAPLLNNGLRSALFATKPVARGIPLPPQWALVQDLRCWARSTDDISRTKFFADIVSGKMDPMALTRKQLVSMSAKAGQVCQGRGRARLWETHRGPAEEAGMLFEGGRGGSMVCSGLNQIGHQRPPAPALSDGAGSY